MRLLTRVARSAGLILLGSMLALLLAEGASRVLDPDLRDLVIPSGLVTIEPGLGWRLRARANIRHQTRNFDVAYDVNGWGGRDVPRSPDKATGQYRVLLYGDSQVFGWGIPLAARFSNRVEQAEPTVELWNFAVPGYGLDQEVLAYEQGGANVHADEVVMWVSVLTLDRCAYGFLYQKYKPRFVLSDGELVLQRPPPDAVARNAMVYRWLSPWHLPHFVDRRWRVLRQAWQPGAPQTSSDSAARDAVAAALLERVSRMAQSRGHAVTVLADVSPEATRVIGAVRERLGLQVVTIDLPEPRNRWYLESVKGHWNAAAHELIAEQWRAQWVRRR